MKCELEIKKEANNRKHIKVFSMVLESGSPSIRVEKRLFFMTSGSITGTVLTLSGTASL